MEQVIEKTNDVLGTRVGFKPFQYPRFYEIYRTHFGLNWTPEETRLDDDVYDWKHKLSANEKQFLTNIFRFFTEADVDVAGAYSEVYLPAFKLPEIRMMLLSFAEREGTHMRAYSHLIDTLGMPSSIYKVFMEYTEMADKHQYVESFMTKENEFDIHKLLKQIAVFSVFTEGMQLFSSFIMLLNFSRFNKMKGMSEIVRWSIRDENLHYEGMAELFKTVLREDPQYNTDALREEIYEVGYKMVELEDKFIDLCFNQTDIEGLTKEEVKEYIRFIADRRLIGVGYKGIFKIKDNPLPWVDEMLSSVGHGNFFEGRVTDYSRGVHEGSWNGFWAKPVAKKD